MKAKPDIRAFVADKDPTAFLEGGAGDKANRSTSAPPKVVAEPVKPELTVQKLFRLRWDVANALKTAALNESISSGKRVTETEIVETLIRQRFKIAR